MKILFITDTHLGLYNDSDDWLDVVLKIFKEVEYVCKNENINTIIHGGDFFHNTRSINKKTLDCANYIVNGILIGIKIYTIVGNHDIFYKNKIKPNSLQIFENNINVNIIDSPTEFQNILLVPWGFDIPTTQAEYCYGHFGINGFKMNDSFTCSDGMEATQFSSFRKVYSGHFHKKSSISNITYLGSPYQQTFSDTNNERGFHLWDDGELLFIESSHPLFLKVEANNIDESKIPGNIIKLLFESGYDSDKTIEIIDKVKSLKPFTLSVDLSKVIEQEEEEKPKFEDVSLLNTFEIFKKYIENIKIPKGISKTTLLKMSKNLIDEIVE